MITATEIKLFRKPPTSDWEATEELKKTVAQFRVERQPLHLTAAEFEDILKWKFDRQVGRQRKLRSANTDELIRTVTGFARNVTHDDKEYELEPRLDALCALRGVGVAVASAVLALVFPEDYAVIDFRVWRQLFGEDRTTFSYSDYHQYLRTLRRLADELGWQVQEVDHAIWEYDRRSA